MSIQTFRYSSAVRSQTVMRNAARDGVIGALLGLLLLSGLIVSQIDVRQMVSDNRELLSLLATVVAVIVLQCGIAAGLCGFVIRRVSAPD